MIFGGAHALPSEPMWTFQVKYTYEGRRALKSEGAREIVRLSR